MRTKNDAEPTCGENTPVKYLKRDGMSLESDEAQTHAGRGKKFEKADYISGEKDNPHASPKKTKCSWYSSHGKGC
jgi:hypothetical protein